MAEIKIEELKKLNKQVEEIIELEYQGLNLEIRQYLDVLEKIGLASSVAMGCINREDGLFIVKHGAKDIAYKLEIIKKYTNLTLPNDEIEAFDLISRSGILDVVLENIPSKELSTLYELLEDKITEERDKYNQENRLESIIKKGVDGLLYTLENFVGDGTATDLIESVKTALGEIEPDKLEFVKQFIAANSGVK